MSKTLPTTFWSPTTGNNPKDATHLVVFAPSQDEDDDRGNLRINSFFYKKGELEEYLTKYPHTANGASVYELVPVKVMRTTKMVEQAVVSLSKAKK